VPCRRAWAFQKLIFHKAAAEYVWMLLIRRTLFLAYHGGEVGTASSLVALNAMFGDKQAKRELTKLTAKQRGCFPAEAHARVLCLPNKLSR